MQFLIDSVNFLSDPRISFTFVACLVLVLFPQTEGLYALHRRLKLNNLWTLHGGVLIMLALTLTVSLFSCHPHFRSVAFLPDNVPSIVLLFLIVFFAWFSMYQAWKNDALLDQGDVPQEKKDNEKVLVWPDLVFIELIAMLALLAVIIFWGVSLPAPLEGVANPAHSPNPAKAPWYFLALQEMLVYFDPWFAGVLIPTFLILFLVSVPYIDPDRKHTGFYCFKNRKFFVGSFMCFFIGVWVYLLFVGNILRGPNWNFFGPLEFWDPHKVVAVTNVNLSEYIYMVWLHRPLPDNIFLREIGGILFLISYYAFLPLVLSKTILKDLYQRVSTFQYALFSVIYISLWLLPVKMYLRWLFNLKYIISIPELLLNI